MSGRRAPIATPQVRPGHGAAHLHHPTSHHLLRHVQRPAGNRCSTGSGSSGTTTSTVDGISTSATFSSTHSNAASSLAGLSISTTCSWPDLDCFERRHGRQYLRNRPYPYPIDLTDFQRQNLQTLIATTVVGRPLCGPLPPPSAGSTRPLEILDLGCGTGYMAVLIHNHILSLGLPAPLIIGLDIMPDDPFGRNPVPGMRWRYVRHDLIVRQPFPFPDDCFDIVLAKDMSSSVAGPLIDLDKSQVSTPMSASTTHDFDIASNGDQQLIGESIRTLRVGGTIEFWDFDRSVRSIRTIGSKSNSHSKTADGTIKSSPFFETDGMITSFTATKNSFLASINRWAMDYLNNRHIEMAPSTGMAAYLVQEVDHLQNVAQRRFAIPLGKCPWERLESASDEQADPSLHLLTRDQLAIRNAALQLVIQTIESLEPMVADVSGLSDEEWDRWKVDMKRDLLQKGGVDNGECFEMGVWWATKQ